MNRDKVLAIITIIGAVASAICAISHSYISISKELDYLRNEKATRKQSTIGFK